MKKLLLLLLIININLFAQTNDLYIPIATNINVVESDYSLPTDVYGNCEPGNPGVSYEFLYYINPGTYTTINTSKTWSGLNMFTYSSTLDAYSGISNNSITNTLTVNKTSSYYKESFWAHCCSSNKLNTSCSQNGSSSVKYDVTFFKFGFKQATSQVCKVQIIDLKSLVKYYAPGMTFHDLSDLDIGTTIDINTLKNGDTYIDKSIKVKFTCKGKLYESFTTIKIINEPFDYFTAGANQSLCNVNTVVNLYGEEVNPPATDKAHLNTYTWNTKQDYDVIEMQSKDTIDASLGYADNSSNFIRFYNTAAGFPSDGSNSTYNSMTLKSAKIMLDINATVEVELQKQISADGYTENLGDLSFSAIFYVKANEPYTININKKIFGVGLSNDTYRLVVKSINGNYFNSSSTSQPNQPNGLYQNNISFGYNGNERLQIGNSSQKSAFFDVLFVFNKTTINNDITFESNGYLDLEKLTGYNQNYPINLTYSAQSNNMCDYKETKIITYDRFVFGSAKLNLSSYDLCHGDTIDLINNTTNSVNIDNTVSYSIYNKIVDSYIDTENNLFVLNNNNTSNSEYQILTTATTSNNCIIEEFQDIIVTPKNNIIIINTNENKLGFNESINLDYTSERTATNLVWNLSDGQYSYLDKPKFYLYDQGENVSVSLTVYDDNNCPITEKLNDAFFVTSTKDINGKDISVYPIPFNNELNIFGYDHNVSIVDVNGKEVLNGSKILNTSSLSNGTYFLKIENKSLKIIK